MCVQDDPVAPWRRKLGDEVVGGMAVLVGMLRRERGLLEALSDDGAAPPQPWHDAQVVSHAHMDTHTRTHTYTHTHTHDARGIPTSRT